MTDRDTMSFPPDKDDIEANSLSQSASTSAEDGANSAGTRSPDDVLSAIADPDCQTILAASAKQPISVSDVVDQCNIPTATAYRKVDMLVDAGLLHERIQIRPYGRNERQYSLRVDTVHVNITDSGRPEATITITNDEGIHRFNRAITDGGQTTHDSDEITDEISERRGLEDIFVDLTGTEEVVDEQERERQTKHLADDSEHSVSEYISTAARNDGLSESLPDSEGQTEE